MPDLRAPGLNDQSRRLDREVSTGQPSQRGESTARVALDLDRPADGARESDFFDSRSARVPCEEQLAAVSVPEDESIGATANEGDARGKRRQSRRPPAAAFFQHEEVLMPRSSSLAGPSGNGGSEQVSMWRQPELHLLFIQAVWRYHRTPGDNLSRVIESDEFAESTHPHE